jgi:GNAT superfamily N-acetyltransferase
MPPQLTRIPFTEELLPKVQAFDCGSEPWQLEVSNWIKAPPGAAGAVDALSRNVQVWLYADEQGNLVGFGSLAEAMQRWPRSKDDPIPVSLIPWLAVDRRFWGKPEGPPEERFAVVILRDLLAEARAIQDERPLLILFVHVDNAAAIKLYERAGFKELHKSLKDKQTGWLYKRMALLLKDQPA